MSIRDVTYQDVGKRLARVRRTLGLTQSAMAERMGMPFTRWNNYELGVSLIPVAEALKLKRIVPGLSTDWVYGNDRSSLSVGLAAALDAAELDETKAPAKKRGRSSAQR